MPGSLKVVSNTCHVEDKKLLETGVVSLIILF